MSKEKLFDSASAIEASRLLSPYFPIGIDLDGVMVNSVDVTLRQLNQMLGTNYSLTDITHSYRLDDLYKEALNCTISEANSYMSSLWNSKESMEDSEPIFGALELISHFDSINAPYYFVTSRPFSVRGYTENWFTKNGLNSHFLKAVMQSSDNYNKNHKIEVIRDYGIKVFFEDMAEHATAIVKNTDALVVLVNYPANENLPNHERIIRPQNRKNYGDLWGSYLNFLNYLKK